MLRRNSLSVRHSPYCIVPDYGESYAYPHPFPALGNKSLKSTTDPGRYPRKPFRASRWYAEKSDSLWDLIRLSLRIIWSSSYILHEAVRFRTTARHDILIYASICRSHQIRIWISP